MSKYVILQLIFYEPLIVVIKYLFFVQILIGKLGNYASVNVELH